MRRGDSLPCFLALAWLAAPAAMARPGCTHQAIYSVSSVNRDHRAPTPMLTATGTALSGGWSDPILSPVSISRDGATLTLRFMACPPEGYATQALEPMEARLPMSGTLAKVRQVVVISDTDAQILNWRRWPKPKGAR
jgi:hypothetical protein